MSWKFIQWAWYPSISSKNLEELKCLDYLLGKIFHVTHALLRLRCWDGRKSKSGNSILMSLSVVAWEAWLLHSHLLSNWSLQEGREIVWLIFLKNLYLKSYLQRGRLSDDSLHSWLHWQEMNKAEASNSIRVSLVGDRGPNMCGHHSAHNACWHPW